MKLIYYGHACFAVTINKKKLLFDPFISGNELAKHINIADIDADYILVSHGHADHIYDCVTIAQSTGALVICNWEIYEWLSKKGVKNIHPMNTGGTKEFGDFKVKCTVAQHSGGMPDGTYGGNPMGFIVYGQEKSFYYSGDTALTMDMQLIRNWAKLNFAVLPIGDNFTMGAEDAAEAAKMINCNKVIGVHYDTFGFIKIDHKKSKEVFKAMGTELILLNIGETIDL